MQSPSQKWLEKMADGEDQCQSVSVAGDPSRTPWRWLDANHGIGSGSRPVWPIVIGIVLFLVAMTGSNWYWFRLTNRLEQEAAIMRSVITAQDYYKDRQTIAIAECIKLLNQSGVFIEWRDGKPVRVPFNE